MSNDAIARQVKLARDDLLADVPGALERYRYWLEVFYRLRPRPRSSDIMTERADPNYDTLHERAMDLPTRVPGQRLSKMLIEEIGRALGYAVAPAFKPGDRVVLEFNGGDELHGTVVKRGPHCLDDQTSVHYDDREDEPYNTTTSRLRRE